MSKLSIAFLFVVSGMIVFLIFISVPLYDFVISSGNQTERVEYKKSFGLNDGKESINYERNTDKKSYFLGIGGTVVDDKFSITLDNGNTIKPELKDLKFKIGKDWEIVERGIEVVNKKSKEKINSYVSDYIIIGNKEEITNLVSELTKTFDMEFPIEQDGKE